MASVRRKGLYEADDLLDEFLLNQVAKHVNYLKLCSFAKDLGVSQTEYDKITAPNTYTQDEQIHKVSRFTIWWRKMTMKTPSTICLFFHIIQLFQLRLIGVHLIV